MLKTGEYLTGFSATAQPDERSYQSAIIQPDYLLKYRRLTIRHYLLPQISQLTIIISDYSCFNRGSDLTSCFFTAQ